MNRNSVVRNCEMYEGKKYVWGGESVEEGGYDCSGYIYNVLRDSGLNVGRTTADGYRKLGKKIPADQKQPGDLLFFGTPARATHIAIYAGNGKMWESIGGSTNTKSNPGKGVTMSNVSRRKDLFEVCTLFNDGQVVDIPEREDVPRNWLQHGDEGQKVTDMQLLLISVGYPCGNAGADGEYGKDTKTAVEKFQRENGLKVDGFYGANSKSKLESIYIAQKAVNKQKYIKGNTYTLQAEMKVRTGAGTKYEVKKYADLTTDGRKHDADGDGALDKGTRVTCQGVKTVSNDTWIETPSGWIAAEYGGKVYIQ